MYQSFRRVLWPAMIAVLAGATRLSVSAQPGNCPANRVVQKSLAEVRQKFAFSPETVIGILRHVISGALCGAQGIPVRQRIMPAGDLARCHHAFCVTGD